MVLKATDQATARDLFASYTGLIRAVPANFFVTPTGTLISLNASCGTVNSVVG
mgnify:CR=1 FL=1